MDAVFWLAGFLILWGLATLLIALLKPQSIWGLGKIQGFVQLLGDTGAAILFSLLALIALVAGVLLLR